LHNFAWSAAGEKSIKGPNFALSLIRPEGQVHVVSREALWSRDKGALGWVYTGPHSWLHAQHTNLGQPGLQQIDFVLWN